MCKSHTRRLSQNLSSHFHWDGFKAPRACTWRLRSSISGFDLWPYNHGVYDTTRENLWHRVLQFQLIIYVQLQVFRVSIQWYWWGKIGLKLQIKKGGGTDNKGWWEPKNSLFRNVNRVGGGCGLCVERKKSVFQIDLIVWLCNHREGVWW